ncbi:hypothetical protein CAUPRSCDRAFT_10686 [Caulochytrium protostelioides]|uniref:Methyltransferase domain-containing protein n=1 Tax=Caulochytrium protostelioides TaxID=1555241 RepID=A0A4P9WYL7_9FUNG|nr:hypothetical protein CAUPRSCDRAFT_10686 [Caulochytrium protostelioides]
MPPLLPVRDVVDVGAGQGYLDRVLAHGCGLHVLGLDNDTIQTCGAVAPKGGRAAASALKSRSSTVGTLTYRNVHIDHAEQLDAIYRAWRATPGGRSQDPAEDDGPPSRGATEPASASTSAYLLTGLHACGDLGSLILRAWTTCPSAVAVVMVGCCYNRLTESSAVTPTSTNPTFPLSRALRGMNYPLGFTARTLACQALVRWESDPNTPLNFRKHHWRALLQVVLRDHHLIPASPAAATATAMLDGADGTNIAPAACIQVGRLGKAAFKRDFATYALHALAALGAIDHVAAALANPPSVAAPLSPAWAARPGAQLTAHTRVPSRAELVSYEAAYAASERHVAAVWTLRALLAEPLETVILIDRFVAMQEANPAATGPPDLDTPTAATERTVALVPLFDQAVSPRNMVLLGIKPPPPAGSADERPTA